VPYSISGTVLEDAAGLENVRVIAYYNGAATASDLTDANGDYTIANLTDAQTYTVVPIFPGYAFTPASQSVALSGADETGVDFAAVADGIGVYRTPGSLEVEWALNQLPTMRATYRAPVGSLDVLVPGYLGSVVVGSTVVFVGSVDSVRRKLLGGRTDTEEVTITATGLEGVLRRRVVDIEYATTVTVADIIDDLESQVLQASGGAGEEIAIGTIDADTTALIYPSFPLWMAGDVLDHLAEVIGGYWYIAPWPPVLHLRQFGATSASWALSTSAAVKNIEAEQNRNEYANIVYVTNGTLDDYGVDAAEIAARQEAEGGSGRYERVVSVDANMDATQIGNEADRLVELTNEFPREVTYTTTEDDLAVGMNQTVNLEDEFGIPAGTTMRIQRLVLRELNTLNVFEWDVTLQSQPVSGAWERKFKQMLMPGTYGIPRYYRP